MKHDSSTESWNQVGQEVVDLLQTNESRLQFIMPNMLKFIGDVKDKKILDLGCGEGGYSRKLAENGADVTAVDCSEYFIDFAIKQAKLDNLSILHYIRNSNDLQDIKDNSFDIVLCSMVLMDCEDLYGTVEEVTRVLKPSGKFFVSVLHPCFSGNNEKGIGRQGQGIDREVVVKNYFQPEQWEAPLPPSKASVIWRHRTLQDYVKVFIKCGLTIVDLNEPSSTDEQAKNSVQMAWLQKIPLYLYWELKK